MLFRSLDLPRRNLFPAVGTQRLGKEELQPVSPEFGLYELAVRNPADRGNIQPRPLGNILQDHGPQRSLISRKKELMLIVHDGMHGIV